MIGKSTVFLISWISSTLLALIPLAPARSAAYAILHMINELCKGSSGNAREDTMSVSYISSKKTTYFFIHVISNYKDYISIFLNGFIYMFFYYFYLLYIFSSDFTHRSTNGSNCNPSCLKHFFNNIIHVTIQTI